MVKKEVFEWIINRQNDDVIIFQCGRNILRRKIIKKEEGNLTDILRKDNYKNIIPSASTLEEAINYIKKLYGTTEGIFTAYFFDLSQ